MPKETEEKLRKTQGNIRGIEGNMWGNATNWDISATQLIFIKTLHTQGKHDPSV